MDPKRYYGGAAPVSPRIDDEQARAVEAALRAEIRRGEVSFTRGARALYAADASNYRYPPVGVVVPHDLDEVVATVNACRQHGVPVLARGGGTSLAGQCTNVAVVIDTTRHFGKILEIDPDRRLARVQAGTILDDLRRAAAPYGLTFGPDPSTHDHCTIGGMIGNNACGVHAVLAEFYGSGPRTEDNLHSMDVLLYDGTQMTVGPTPDEDLRRLVAGGGRQGEIYRRLRDLRDRYEPLIRERFPDIPRRVSGYNLPALLPEAGFNVARALCGTEGTCAITLTATVRLCPAMTERALLVLGYPSVFQAADHIPRLRELRPVGCEGIDRRLIEDIQHKHLHPERARRLPEGDGWLLVEFGGAEQAEAEAAAREAMAQLERESNPPRMCLLTDPEEMEQLWQIRESGLGATAWVPGQPDTWPGWEDSAVPPDALGGYLRDLDQLYQRYGYEADLYGHFGQGCVHTRIEFPLRTAEGVEEYRRFTREATELVLRHGGSLSGEHGDGQARGDLLPLMYGNDVMEAFREFQRIWDPGGMVNPHKVIDAYPRTASLRLGADYRPWEPETEFNYPADDGKFSRAALRCVGVGKCLRQSGGVMCPSYMVTREEKHTTRGRAHLLFEMLKGEVITDGWQSEEVKESLDLCLACKGCKTDCPVSVDIATYKAEFLSHYYEERRRPRQAWAFGLIHRWAPLGALLPRLTNLLAGAPGLGAAARWMAGMAPERDIPTFAPMTFRRWWRRQERAGEGRPVILWADTFNNHFHPHILAAAAEVLIGAGCRVIVPDKRLCCGRALYDYGMLSTARELLEEVLEELSDEVAGGAVLVGVEPSCVAALRDELPALLDDPRAKRLAERTYSLGELLRELEWTPPRRGGEAMFHPHCHAHAVLDPGAEASLLRAALDEVRDPDAGCCGMAGSFGFEREKYDVSMAAGERVLFPAVREAGREILVVADGFSCRTQIEQGTGREALHTAEVLQMAIQGEQARPKAVGSARPRELVWRAAAGVWWVGLALASAALLVAAL